MYKFLRIFLAGWLLFSCSSDEPEVVEELKKANAKDFSFSLLSVSAKEVSVEKIKSILKSPAGWTIKSLKIDDTSFAEVEGASEKYFKIKIKKAGEFSFSITFQKTGYEDFILKGVKIKVTSFKADAKDFNFPRFFAVLTDNEITIEQLKKNLKSPAGWAIKSIKIDDKSFAEVTGTIAKDFKIKLKKAGTFTATIVLEKTNYIDIAINNCEFEISKLIAPKLTFTKFEKYNNDKIITAKQILANVGGAKAGYNIKSINDISDANIAEVKGTEINLKKLGTFTAEIVLESDNYEDATLKNCSFSYINIFNVDGTELKGYNDDKYKKSIKIIDLPDVIEGKTIKTIGKQAFAYSTALASIKLPNSVTSIGEAAFRDCTSLTSITLPDKLISIGVAAFFKCSSLSSITIPNSVTTIGKAAFRDCTSLSSITIPNKVTTINTGTFQNCTSLTSVIIPNSVTSIGGEVFYNCTSLSSVTIPNSVTSIGGQVFYNCTSLTSVTISTSVTTINTGTFQNCTSLTSVTIPNSVTYIENLAFYGCSGLTSVTIPNSVTSIGSAAFSDCSSLTSLTISNKVTSIENEAFYNCTSLTSVTIPNSVTYIGNNVFKGSNKLVVTIEQTDPKIITLSSGAFGSHSEKNIVKKIKVPAASLDDYKARWIAYKYIMEGY